METKPPRLSISREPSSLNSTKSRLPKPWAYRSEFIRAGAIALVSLGLALLAWGLATSQSVRADSPQGGPTKTPTRTPEPGYTATFILPPLTTPTTPQSSDLNLPLVRGPGGTPWATPKSLPTGTIYDQAALVLTLEARNQAAQAQAAEPDFWFFILVIILSAVAVVIFVLISLLRQKQPPSSGNPPNLGS